LKPVVIDPSASAAWVMPDEASDAARDLYALACAEEGLFHAPQLWQWEMGNLLVMGHVRKRIAAELVEQGLEILAAARVSLDAAPNPHRQSQVARLALTHGLTFYDAAYLELVLRLNGQLASADRALLAAAKACGIVCMTF
jgi:predicted nucleic acid-binding protein